MALPEWMNTKFEVPEKRDTWKMPVLRINWPIMVLAITWSLIETRYFGWNRSPQSVPELFADGLGFFMAALSYWGTGS